MLSATDIFINIFISLIHITLATGIDIYEFLMLLSGKKKKNTSNIPLDFIIKIVCASSLNDQFSFNWSVSKKAN